MEENVNEVREVKVRVQGSALMGSRAKREIDESSYLSSVKLCKNLQRFKGRHPFCKNWP